MQLYADIVLPLAQPVYTFAVPEGTEVAAGQAVAVQFGARKFYTGIVWRVHDRRPDFKTVKPIQRVLYDAPLLSGQQMSLWEWIASYYMCSLGEVMRVALPALMKPSGDTEEEFSDEEFRPRTECYVSLAAELRDEGRFHEICEKIERRAPKQYEALLELAAAGDETRISTGEVARRLLRADYAVLHALERKKYIVCTQRERSVERGGSAFRLPELTAQQLTALEALRGQFAAGKTTALLQGVTGSGKTEVYIHLIAEVLARGGDVLLLVPEIALTPQLLRQFSVRYGARVAVLHSALRISERYETWKRIRSGDADVVLGTRSAVFAPVRDLGLLIVDEEQEHTYQSENAPRYHAREVAIYRGAQEHALTVLGSATPTVESMYRAVTGAFGLCRMTERYNGRPLPPVEIVDMKRELREGNASIISEPLLLALRENLRLGQQSILYLNRRGTSRMLACVECGSVPMCPGCSLPLTYHHANGRLMCHICGHSEPVPARCPVCGGHLRQIGCGTQRVEEQLQNLLPGVGVLRMDADTVSAVNTHEKLFRRFREERIPILLGTQMVAKGLDFENVTLSAVLDADLSLYASDYRAAETTFSLIAQVAGRAGRGKLGGRAILQTMTPQNQTIRFAAEQNYDAFFEAELPLRQLRGCPPYRDLLTVTFHGREEERVWQAALAFRARLDGLLHSEFYRGETAAVLGPAPASVARINYHYRCRLTLSCVNTRRLRELLAFLVREFAKDRSFRGVGAFVDVNGRE